MIQKTVAKLTEVSCLGRSDTVSENNLTATQHRTYKNRKATTWQQIWDHTSSSSRLSEANIITLHFQRCRKLYTSRAKYLSQFRFGIIIPTPRSRLQYFSCRQHCFNFVSNQQAYSLRSMVSFAIFDRWLLVSRDTCSEKQINKHRVDFQFAT